MDKDIKKSFLSSQKPNTAKQTRTTLFKIDEAEIQFNKRASKFSLVEIEQLMLNRSKSSINSKLSHMRNYVDYLIQNGAGEINNFRAITNIFM